MGIQKLFGQAIGLGASTVSTVSKTGAVVVDGVGDVVGGVGEVVGAGIGFVGATIGGIKLLGLTESSSTYQHEKFDEKHYFLIPDLSSEYEYSLYIMRVMTSVALLPQPNKNKAVMAINSRFMNPS